MNRPGVVSAVICAALWSCLGVNGDLSSQGEPDSGALSTTDAGSLDSGNAAPLDAAIDDAGAPDASSVDGGFTDAGLVDAGATTADAGAPTDAGVFLLGTVTPRGVCVRSRTQLPDASCETVTVSGCADLAPLDVDLVIAEPPTGAPVVGTIIFGSGSGGGAMWEQMGQPALDALTHLRSGGYRVVERAWAGSNASGQWFAGTQGPTVSACRYATLATWLKTRFAQGAFCGTGNSGGAVELALALSRWGRGAIFDAALITSGPVARFDEACAGTTDTSWATRCTSLLSAASPVWACGAQAQPQCDLVPGIKGLVDNSFADAQVCRAPTGHETQLETASPLSAQGSVKRFDATSVAFLFGQQDCDNGVVPNGLAYATQVTSRGQPAAISVLSGVGHSMGAYADGGLAIEQRLTALCHP